MSNNELHEADSINKNIEFPIEALVAIINKENIIAQHEIVVYGKLQSEPVTEAYKELCKRFSNRKGE
jgi:hypothetical protein